MLIPGRASALIDTRQPLALIKHGNAGTVSSSHRGRIGLNLMLAGLAPIRWMPAVGAPSVTAGRARISPSLIR
jgi:hypothetical protein